MATIKDIAVKCGVSRGTVDRVLNNRGKVNPQKAELIREVAKDLNFQPNKAGLALRARAEKKKVTVILTSIGNSFFDEVIGGIDKASSDFKDFGLDVELVKIKGYDPKIQLQAIEKAETTDFLILNPIDDEMIRNKLNQLAEKSLPTIHINTDLENTERLRYVGCDYFSNGQTAANMLALSMDQSRQDILLVTGSEKIYSHNQRTRGFSEFLNKNFPHLQIKQILACQDDDEVAYKITKEALNNFNFAGIYIVAAGTKGVCKAVSEVYDAGSTPHIVCSDVTKASSVLIRSGLIKAAICQEPFQQGYKSIQTAFKFLIYGQKPKKNYITNNEIKVHANLGGKYV